MSAEKKITPTTEAVVIRTEEVHGSVDLEYWTGAGWSLEHREAKRFPEDVAGEVMRGMQNRCRRKGFVFDTRIV